MKTRVKYLLTFLTKKCLCAMTARERLLSGEAMAQAKVLYLLLLPIIYVHSIRTYNYL